MKRVDILYIIIVSGVLAFSCEKVTVYPDTASLNIRTNYMVSGEELITDTLNYTNVSSNVYSIKRLEYYLSDFILTKSDGSSYTVFGTYYFNAVSNKSTVITLDEIPLGDYITLSFLVGVPESSNVPLGLENDLLNTNMAWPVSMGGGYHFLKMEGHFIDQNNTRKGYALHVGTNACLGKVELPFSRRLTLKNRSAFLSVDVNQWFDGIVPINLNDQNYTMGNIPEMLKVAKNSQRVFTIN